MYFAGGYRAPVSNALGNIVGMARVLMFILFSLFVVWGTSHVTHMEVRGQLEGTSSPLLPSGS